MSNEDVFALFVGIDSYTTYDPSGGANLRGSINDAMGFWRVGLELGIAPENMKILTSGRFNPSDLVGANETNTGEATERGILDGVAWLTKKLAASAGSTALFTYSGHGAYTIEKGLLLCPSDTEGPDLEHAIPYTTLKELLSPVSGAVTALLDCCHSGAGRDVLSLTPGPLPEGVKDDDQRVASRVLAACKVGQTAKQARFLGTWYGAFTWAVGATLDQWRAVRTAGGARFDLTYGELVEKARRLVETLRFQETPVLLGPPNVAELSVLQPGDVPAETSATPDGKRQTVQIDAGEKNYRWYTFTSDDTHWKWNVLVPNVKMGRSVTVNGQTYYAGIEYWISAPTNHTSAQPSNYIEVEWTDYTSTESPSYVGHTSFEMRQDARWSPTAAPEGSPTEFINNRLGVGMCWQMQLGSDGRWTGSITWWNTTEENNIFGGDLSSGQTLYNQLGAQGSTWYTTTVTATAPTA